MASRLWRFLTTDISELLSGETVGSTADAAEVVFELAEVLKEEGPNVQRLAPLVDQLDSLLDALNSPLAEIVEKSLPFVSIATGLLKFYLEKSKKPLSLANCVAIASQAAYLESLKHFLQEDEGLQQQVGQVPASDEIRSTSRKLGEIEITDEEARRAATSFPSSGLAKRFGEVLATRLVQAGLMKELAHRLTERVKWRTPLYLNEVWAASAEAVKHLGQPTFENWRQEQAKYLSIEDYLRKQIAPGPQEQVFDEEDLSFCDIYVPPQVKRLDRNGELISEELLDLEHRVTLHLMKAGSTRYILFIDGEAGRGKSVFCRMYADWVRRQLYPAYVPIFVKLRHLKVLESNLTQTLSNFLQNQDFVTSDSGWLTDDNTRFLFLLDGFDELLLEGRETGGLKELLEQVEQFHRGSHHRFLITGRPLSLQNIGRLISQRENLERLELQSMGDELRQQWYSNWMAKFGQPKTEALQHFLSCSPNDVHDSLAREPLLLYLLGRMHREGQLRADMFDRGAGMNEAKVAIYDAAARWVIEKQRQNENVRQSGLETEDLRRALAEAAVCIVQSGNETAKVSFLEARLQKDSDNPMYKLLQEARKEVAVSDEKLLNNLLTTFYLKPASGDKGGSVEFAHKSFGEFLFAERLRDALEDWSQSGQGRRNKYMVPDGEMYWQVYDLLGYGGLTVEVMGYLSVLLAQSRELKPVTLFERLEDFYLRWWNGEFIDASANNLPQRKMMNLRERVPEREEPLGLRQMDAVTGLNVMVLLFELHRYGQARERLKAKMTFHPCGMPETETFEETRLYRITGYAECLNVLGFNKVVGKHLRNANFHSAYLRSVDLSLADLSLADLCNTYLFSADLHSTDFSLASLCRAYLYDADLRRANFYLADLYRANLHSASLYRANLSRASLYRADLRNANLSRANFFKADLSCADLRHANLRRANFHYANLKGILWNVDTDWTSAEGIHEVENVSPALAQEPSFIAAAVLSQGLALAKRGQILKAVEVYRQAQEVKPDIYISAYAWNILCWNGCLYGHLTAVLDASENAIGLKSEHEAWLGSKELIKAFDVRGLTRALANNLDGALADFQVALGTTNVARIFSEEQRSRRERWVAALQSGQNPFTPEELAALREAEAIR
ncbi:MAG: pentapeptide repeat-containing protein [Cyanobacteria bacterium P01_A01_bin.135]